MHRRRRRRLKALTDSVVGSPLSSSASPLSSSGSPLSSPSLFDKWDRALVKQSMWGEPCTMFIAISIQKLWRDMQSRKEGDSRRLEDLREEDSRRLEDFSRLPEHTKVMINYYDSVYNSKLHKILAELSGDFSPVDWEKIDEAEHKYFNAKSEGKGCRQASLAALQVYQDAVNNSNQTESKEPSVGYNR